MGNFGETFVTALRMAMFQGWKRHVHDLLVAPLMSNASITPALPSSRHIQKRVRQLPE